MVFIFPILKTHGEQGVDIACTDCHANTRPHLRLAHWPAAYRRLQRLIPYPLADTQEFKLTKNGTPLWHIEVRPNGNYLHRKVQGGVIKIPRYTANSHPLQQVHKRLTCAACHSQWAPQCYGCHMRFERDARQWDYLESRETPGRWTERRWDMRSGLPTLGVTADGHITPFIPGMVLTAEHPTWRASRFARLFSASSPHTSGPSRSCDSCHRSPTALGLGEGELQRADDGWVFFAKHPALEDGLPADAWTTLDHSRSGGSTRSGYRPFTPQEMRRILEALQ